MRLCECVRVCEARPLHSRGSLKLAIKRTESDFYSDTLQALMCGSTTPEKKQCCHYIGQTLGATVSSPHCANMKICHTERVKRGPWHKSYSLSQLSLFGCYCCISMVGTVDVRFPILSRLLSAFYMFSADEIITGYNCAFT